MSLKFRLAVDGTTTTLHIVGRFTFEEHKDFRNILSDIKASRVVVNLARTEYLDSSALGMLLIAKDRLAPATIVLANASGMVKATLNIANFQKVFTIE